MTAGKITVQRTELLEILAEIKEDQKRLAELSE